MNKKRVVVLLLALSLAVSNCFLGISSEAAEPQEQQSVNEVAASENDEEEQNLSEKVQNTDEVEEENTEGDVLPDSSVPAEPDADNVPAEPDTYNVPAEPDTDNVPAEPDTDDIAVETDTQTINDDPGTGRLGGEYVPDEFYGPSLRSRSNGYIHADKFDGYTIKKGIDVSQWNGDIDWGKVKAAGIDFAIIRVAYRGYGSSGSLNMDPYAIENIKGAKAAGIDVGVYIFSQAINTKEAVEEADYILDKINSYKSYITLPVVLDFEYASDANGLTGRLYKANLSKQAATNICLKFCERVESKGYDAMVYANADMLTNDLNASSISEKYDVWLAHYTNKTNYSGDYNFWQYTSTGKVSGISGNVDMNFWYVEETIDDSITVGTTTLTGKATSFDSVNLSWDKVTDVSGYEIQCADSSGNYSTVSTVTKGSTVSTIVSNLLSSTQYKFRIRAYKTKGSAKGYGAYSSAISIKTQSSKWGTVTGSSVNVRKGAGTSYAVYKTLKKGTNLLLTGSQNDDWYQTKVTITSNGKSTKVVGYISKTYVELLSTAGNGDATVATPTLTVTGSAFDTVKLSWTKVSGADGYEIQRYSNGKYSNLETITSGSTTSYSHTYLDSGTTYKYRIRAYANSGSTKTYGDYSSVKSAKTQGSKWGTITGTSVNVYESTSNSSGINKNLKKGTNLLLTGSRSGGWYRTKVTVNGTKLVSYVQKEYVDFLEQTNNSVGVPALTATGSSFDTVKLSWSKVSGADGYEIQRYSNGKYSNLKTITSGSTMTYNHTYLDSETTYKYRIRAYVKNGNTKKYGAYSSVKSVKTLSSKWGTVTASSLNVRKLPSTSAGTYKVLSKNTKLLITGSRSGGWYRTKVTVNGKKVVAYVSKDYVKI